MKNDILTRQECNVLRGLAIIGIFMHNYCHWLPGIVRENEYQFKMENAAGLWHYLSHPDWNLPLHLFSFFGHYGVPVFLFLSAYGLVKKYEAPSLSPSPSRKERGVYTSSIENTDSKTNHSPLLARGAGGEAVGAVSFLLSHFRKLFRMMIVGFAAFVLVDAATPGSHHYRLLDVVAQLGLFNNLLPHPDRIIWPGPYWFFGLMMQLYIVYRLLLYRRHWGFTVALMVICVGIQLMLTPDGEAMNRYRYNFMGGMLPFGLGLLLARVSLTQKRREDTSPARNTYSISDLSPLSSLLSPLFAAVLIFFSADSVIGWTLTPVWICLLAVSVVKVLPAWLLPPLNWMGTVSAALFVCHPIARKIIIPISRQGDVYCGLLLYIVTSLSLAWLFNKILKGRREPQQTHPLPLPVREGSSHFPIGEHSTPPPHREGQGVGLLGLPMGLLSLRRSELMGIAMLIIVMFHVYVPRQSPFFGLHRIGNSGVDIFMLLSGIGMWFSWTKSRQPSVTQFFKRRYARIYPAWFVVALLFYGGDYLTAHRRSTSLTDLAGDVLVNWDYWLSGDYSFWYIPAIMMLYTLTPFYLRLIIRQPVYRWLPVLAMVWSCVVQWVPAVHGAVGHVEAFWSRIPIFLIGINLGQAVKENRSIEGGGIWMPVATFALTLCASIYLEQFYYGRYPLFIERMIYIPMVVSGTLVVGMLLGHVPGWVNRGLAFVGTISLEVYLLHEHFAHVYIRKLDLGYWPTFLLTVTATLPMAWLLSKFAKFVENKIMKR